MVEARAFAPDLRPCAEHVSGRLAGVLGVSRPHAGPASGMAENDTHSHVAVCPAPTARARLDPRLCDAAALPAESPSGAAIRKSASDDLDAALEKLSPRHRQAVQLRIWDQHSFAQIGAKMEISEDAARMLFRGHSAACARS